MAEDFVPDPRKTPLKGEPNFTIINDEKLKMYKDFAQDMMFAFKDFDKDLYKALSKVHGHIYDNICARRNYDYEMAEKKSEKESPKVIETPKKTFRKPLKMKLVNSI